MALRISRYIHLQTLELCTQTKLPLDPITLHQQQNIRDCYTQTSSIRCKHLLPHSKRITLQPSQTPPTASLTYSHAEMHLRPHFPKSYRSIALRPRTSQSPELDRQHRYALNRRAPLQRDTRARPSGLWSSSIRVQAEQAAGRRCRAGRRELGLAEETGSTLDIRRWGSGRRRIGVVVGDG
jgi:hypothetical protein